MAAARVLPRTGVESRRALAIALALGLAVGLLPPLYGAAAAAIGALFLLGLVRPRWPAYLLGLAAPLGSLRELSVGGVGILSTGWAASAPAAAKELLRWVELGGAFGLVVALVRDGGQARRLLAMLMLGGLAESLLGAVQFLFQIGPPSFAVGRFLRAYGPFGQPNQ